MTISIDELERVAADGWQATEQVMLGGWLLRAAAGFTGRANSALALGDPGLPLPLAIDHVRQWYQARGLPAMVAVGYPLGQPEDNPVDIYLAEAGWSVHHGTIVMTTAVGARAVGAGAVGAGAVGAGAVGAGAVGAGAVGAGAVGAGAVGAGAVGAGAVGAGAVGAGAVGAGAVGAGAVGAGAVGPPDGPVWIEVADEPGDGWLDLYRHRGGVPPPISRRLLLSAPWQAFASVRVAGETVAIGRVAAAGGWAGLTAVEVHPGHRRHGLGRVITAALVRAAADRGRNGIYLQVENNNAAARALYQGMGFTDHHGYHYRIEPPAS